LECLTKKEQIKKWSELYQKPISEEEYAEICANLSGFFETLKQWADDEERITQENGNQSLRNTDNPL